MKPGSLIYQDLTKKHECDIATRKYSYSIFILYATITHTVTNDCSVFSFITSSLPSEGEGCVGCDRTPLLDAFFFFFFFFFGGGLAVLVIEVGDVRRYPYPVSGPPPPPPRSSVVVFSGLARLSRLAADLVQNPHPRFHKASYGPDNSKLCQIGSRPMFFVSSILRRMFERTHTAL